MASIVSRYHVVLKDQTGARVAMFTEFASLEFEKVANDIGSFAISFYDNKDPRFALFELDGQIEVYRSLPYAGLDWYLEYEGLVRRFLRTTDESGRAMVMFTGYGYNHLLSRRVIGYKSGTIYAQGVGDLETAVKYFAWYNCDPLYATEPSRIRDGSISGFSSEPIIAGLPYANWTKDHAFENLLDVLREISDYSLTTTPTYYSIYFSLTGNGAGQFYFRTHANQLGENRTVASAYPVVFSLSFGNLRDFSHEIVRSSEENIVIVLGKGEKSTRKVIYRENTNGSTSSPWNDIETVTSASTNEFEYQLEDAGDGILGEKIYRENFSGTPMQTPSCLYGMHYFHGDKVTVEYKGMERDKNIISVSARVENDREELTFGFSDI